MMRRWMRQIVLLSSLMLIAATMSTGLTGASTGAQVDKGLQLYQARCISCHGPELEGAQGPELKNDHFTKDWSDFNALRAFIQKNMPKGRTTPLTTEEAVNAASFLSSKNGIQPDGFAYPDFRQLWTVADQPVAAQQVKRSWLWGPEGFAVEWESYAEAPGGKRLVQYFDKTRMEITRIDARERPDYVTNGLLAKELVTGLRQDGDSAFGLGRPAVVNVAGDPDDAQGPVYASFSKLLGPVGASQAAVGATIDRAGTVGQNANLGNRTAYAYFVPETGHNVPRVFWDYLNSSGPTNRNGQLQDGAIFDPWYAPVGFPITEAYWAKAKVAGQVQDVLVQVFERRVLTYTPNNPEGFQVEMGNVGRHYHTWRYGN